MCTIQCAVLPDYVKRNATVTSLAALMKELLNLPHPRLPAYATLRKHKFRKQYLLITILSSSLNERSFGGLEIRIH